MHHGPGAQFPGLSPPSFIPQVMRTTCHRCDADIPAPDFLEKRLEELMAERAEQEQRVKMGIMREQPKEGVKDSWKCPACRNINFKQRRACHRCNEPKPPPEVLQARKEQEEKREKATERRRQEQIDNEKTLLEEQAALAALPPPPPLMDLMPRLVQCQQRQAQMQQIMNLLQKQLDASRRIATQQAAMLATADLELLGADPETIKAAEAERKLAAEKAEADKRAATANLQSSAIAFAEQLAAKVIAAKKEKDEAKRLAASEAAGGGGAVPLPPGPPPGADFDVPVPSLPPPDLAPSVTGAKRSIDAVDA